MNLQRNIFTRIKDVLSKSPVEHLGDHAGDVAVRETAEWIAATAVQLQKLSPEAMGLITGEKTWLEIDAPELLKAPIRITLQLKQDGEQ